MIPNDQYWSWFWTDVKWRLIVGVPIFLLACGWAYLQFWYNEIHEQKEIGKNYTTLKLR